MKISVITLFPELIYNATSYSILKKAKEKGLLNIECINPRDFTHDKHRTVDDKLYGGGSGMLLMIKPFYDALSKVKRKGSYTILLTPKGKVYNQKKAEDLARKKHLVIICAHYEGIDERITEFVDEEISLGDFILTGGEYAALCIIDSVARLIKGVINSESLKNESFNNYLLEAPHYTRPRVFKGLKVPDVLLSGNHKKIEEWRLNQSLKLTEERRPDLYKKYLKIKRRK